jgi:hypothetical protein
MNEPINGHEPEVMKFSVTADESGLVEVCMTKDMDFIMRTYIGLGDFIRLHLEPRPDLPKFFNDMAGIAEALGKFAAERATNDAEVQPPPEAA